MIIGSKGDYGVRALIDLAMYGDEGPVQRTEIARRQHIPEAYLDHLLAQLRRAGFVRSTRGPQGGHQLTRSPAAICLLHVLEALEGSLAPMPCLDHEDEDSTVCAQQWVWREIYADMRVRLAAVSMADLAVRERERLGQLAASYSI